MAHFIHLLIIQVVGLLCWRALAVEFGKDRVVNVVNRIATEVALMESSEGDCIDSLSRFREELEGTNASIIVLCPSSVFDMDEGKPLPLKTDTMVLCGADGSTSNSCVVNGGVTQFMSYHEIVNVTVKGVTMVGATETAVVLKHSGGVTFENCVFQNSRNAVFRIEYNPDMKNTTFFDDVIQEVVNNVKIFLESVKDWSPMDGIRRHLQVSENIQVPNARSLAVRLVGCTFQGNSVAAQTSAGMITVGYSGTDLLIWDSLFISNDYGSNLQNGYAAMISDGSSVNLRNNCFVNNIFCGIGVIILHTDDIFFPIPSQAINNAGTKDEITTCEFIGLISSNAFESGLIDNLSCVDFDRVPFECTIGSL